MLIPCGGNMVAEENSTQQLCWVREDLIGGAAISYIIQADKPKQFHNLVCSMLNKEARTSLIMDFLICTQCFQTLKSKH
jgi:hypothetical protein